MAVLFRFPLALCFAFYNALHLKEQFTYGAQHNRIRWGQFVHKWMKEILKDWTRQEICLATKCTNIFFSLQQQAKRENQVFSLIEKCFSSQGTFNDSTSKMGVRRKYKMLTDVQHENAPLENIHQAPKSGGNIYNRRWKKAWPWGTDVKVDIFDQQIET